MVSRRLLVLLSASLLALALLTGVASASPAFDLARPFPTRPLSSGVPSAAPTAQARAAVLSQLTDHTAAQVTTQRACAPPSPGHAACVAQVLVLRSDHRRVRPRVPRQRALAQVRPGLPAAQSRSGLASPADAAEQAPPAPGTPAWLQQAYDLTYLSEVGGVGDTVAIIDAYDDPTAEQDLADFRSRYGLTPCTTGCFSQVNQEGQSSSLPSPPPPEQSGWETEESLDLDAVSSLCPNCHIILVEADSATLSDLETAEATGARLGANQLSNSWGAVASGPIGGQMTFPGVATIAATGDDGVLPAGEDQYPAALPGVTAAGGTSLTVGQAGARGFAESAWSGAGAGCDTAEQQPAYQAGSACPGRAYADVSADADPNTGLSVYSSSDGGWEVVGGTSLATPLVAAYEAVTGVDGATPAWAYGDSSQLNDPVSGTDGSCAISDICNAGPGYDGPTGAGSISGQVATGAPGIGGPTVDDGSGYADGVDATSASMVAGVYPNGLDTTYYWEYGTTTAYGAQTAAADVGSGTTPVQIADAIPDLSPGTTYHYRLVAQNSAGTTYGYDYTLTTPAAETAPVDTSQPVVTGTATEGQTLTTSVGAWSPSGTPSYQWELSTNGGASFTAIPNATGASYQLLAADVGADISVVVTETNGDGAASAGPGVAYLVHSAAPQLGATAPSISGTPIPGVALTVQPGTWNPSGTVSYQWQRSTDGGATWSPISNATTGSYTPTAADIGDDLDVVVTESNSWGSAEATAAAVGPVGTGAPLPAVTPAIVGTPARGDELTVSMTPWNPAATAYSFQWQRSTDGSTWTDIPNATAATYVATVADEASTIRVLVTASNEYGSTTVTSTPAGPVTPSLPVDTVPPSYDGLMQVGGALTALPGQWSWGGTIAYQWQRTTGTGWQNIPGATNQVYTLADADAGAGVRVLVTETNVDGSTTAASASPGPIPAVPSLPGSGQSTGTSTPVTVPPPTSTATPPPAPVIAAAPALTGAARVGATVTVSGGEYHNGTVSSVRFERCAQSCTPIGAGSAGAETLTPADDGFYIRAQVTVTGSGGSATAWTQGVLGPVTSATAGTATLTAGGRATVRSPTGQRLAQVTVGSAVAHGATRRRAATETVRFVALKATVRVWACSSGDSATVSCTAPRTLRARGRVTVTVAAGRRVEPVAVLER